jgi:hypothetical protein
MRPLPKIRRHLFLRAWICLVTVLFDSALAVSVHAAKTAPVSKPDVLIFSYGDRLTGRLERMSDGKVVFKTDAAGTVTVLLDKIKELHTAENFAVIITTPKEPFVRPDTKIPVGTLDLANRILTVHTKTGVQILPVKTITYLVDEKSYRAAIQSSGGLFHGWTGSITAGASNVTSTQNVNTYSSGIALTRSVPAVSWMPSRDRTILGFSSTYGSISQPNTPTIETSIFHGNAEQDRYFSQSFYALGHAIFDHNSTQGLDLQQLYGAGIGYTALKNDKQQLNFALTTDYTKQQFTDPANNKNLIGSTFGDDYFYKFPHDIMLTQNGSITPEWNNMNAYSANASVSLSIPVVDNLAFSVQAIDSYLNDPAPGFTPNSLQINAGLSYTLK